MTDGGSKADGPLLPWAPDTACRVCGIAYDKPRMIQNGVCQYCIQERAEAVEQAEQRQLHEDDR